MRGIGQTAGVREGRGPAQGDAIGHAQRVSRSAGHRMRTEAALIEEKARVGSARNVAARGETAIAVDAQQVVGRIVLGREKRTSLLVGGAEIDLETALGNVLVHRVAVERAELGALEVLLELNVHHACDGIRTVDGTRAIIEHFDALDGRLGNHIQVGSRGTTTVHQQQCRIARKSTKTYEGLSRTTISVTFIEVSGAAHLGQLEAKYIAQIGEPTIDR